MKESTICLGASASKGTADVYENAFYVLSVSIRLIALDCHLKEKPGSVSHAHIQFLLMIGSHFCQ